LILKGKKAAIERVITRMCRDVEIKTGRAPEGKVLREIEKRVIKGALRADKRKNGQV
jgi:hypothetical protein